MEQTRQPASIFSPTDLGAIVEALLRSPTRLQPRTAALLAVTAVALGVLGAALFYQTRPGLNIPLWHAVLVVALLLSARMSSVTLAPRQLALLAGSVLPSACIAWRGSEFLQFLDLCSAGLLMLLAIALPPRLGARRMGFVAFVFSLAVGLYSMATGALRLLLLVPRGAGSSGAASSLGRVGIALLLVLPLLVVFGALFISADAVFESWATALVTPNFDAFFPLVFWFVACSCAAAGVFWCALGFEAPDVPGAELPEPRRLRALETGIVLGALVVLFALFVAVQLRYLFGGSDLVQSTVDLTYAEYARRGFFELVVASALLLPVLLTMSWARSNDARATLAFRVLAGALVVLLSVVMASALERLRIYGDTFGLTELRLYAAVFLLWLAAVFVAFTATVLRDRTGEFVWAAVLLGVLTVIALNVANPVALIATTNTSRLDDGRSFDAVYASNLGADAVPVLVDRLERLAPADRCVVARALLAKWSDAATERRGWNYGRMRAADAVQENESRLLSACG
ncbi:MAG: DUF4153 domain-containing protein [Dehalococcoidia bacterium]